MVRLEEHLVEVDGCRYIKYSGLIAMAHERGLVKLSVQVVNHPGPENGSTAVVMATAELKSAATFTEIGDASPLSVGDPRLIPHLLRIAATRAKARALRDALAIPMTALEELTLAHNAVATPAAKACDSATPNQLRVLRAQATALRLPPEELGRLSALTKSEASCQMRVFNDALRSVRRQTPVRVDDGAKTPSTAS